MKINEQLYTSLPNIMQRIGLGKHFIGGDSSSPRFLVVGEQLVLIGVLYTGGGGGGDHITLFKHQIQKRMDELCDGYSLDVIDLRSYRKINLEVNQ